MHKPEFKALMALSHAKAATINKEARTIIEHGGRGGGKNQALLKWIKENETPIDPKLEGKIFRKILKLRKQGWSELRIANYIKKHFKILVV